jgi:hypothetical protein
MNQHKNPNEATDESQLDLFTQLAPKLDLVPAPLPPRRESAADRVSMPDYVDRLILYFESIVAVWIEMSAEECDRFQEWKDEHPHMRNSDWPGWLQRIGARPRPTTAIMERVG